MTWVDLAVFGFLAISGLLAFVRGLVREVLGIGAWIGAIAAAILSMPVMREFVHNWVSSPTFVDPISFILVFLGSLIILILIAGMVGRVVRRSALGGVDRTLGLVFGLVRGAGIVMTACVLTQLVFPPERWPDAIRHARTLKPTYEAAQWVVEKIPLPYRPHLDRLPPEREITAEDLQHATPQGRATGRPTQHD
jgi:membrane protein required for colicin V production